MMKQKGILVVVSGFSGAGKGTLMKRLLQTYDNYALSISKTTREPRKGEQEGKEYFFVTKDAFEEQIQKNELLEYAQYVDHYYGTPRAYVEKQLEQGKDVILEIEIQGALQIKKRFEDALLLFVTPPSAQELYRRLMARGTETEEEIRHRMQRAVEESMEMDQYEYILVNDDLEQCVQQMHLLIQSAKASAPRNHSFIEKIRTELMEIEKGER